MNITQAQEYICDIQKFAKKNTLEHTQKYLELLGSPCAGANIIHVAGTNGKGSVCNYLRALLEEHGYSTGMFVSPHLVDMRERIQRDGEPVSEEEFLRAFNRVMEVTERAVSEEKDLHHPTFFEFLFLMAMVVFEEQKPDYIILETGMGGRLDATNVFARPKLTVITEIGLDHCQYLGDTKEKIAAEKAGIVKPEVPLVYVNRDKNVSAVLSQAAERCGSAMFAVDKTRISDVNINNKTIDFSYKSRYYNNVSYTLASSALYQVENAATALLAFEVLLGREQTELEKMQKAVACTTWAGRMEQIAEDVYVDGAHNEDGVEAFLASVARQSGDRRRLLLFSAVSDKDYVTMINRVEKSGLFEIYVVAGITDERGLSAQQIRNCFERCDSDNIHLCESVQDAYEKALELKGDGVLYIAGSLYLAGEIKALLKEETK
nr:bifunctional folylpolyglutamate synthase/dihydrofolate synthase [Lachnospiraceae bacterium]